jgi:hypothetical protein
LSRHLLQPARLRTGVRIGMAPVRFIMDQIPPCASACRPLQVVSAHPHRLGSERFVRLLPLRSFPPVALSWCAGGYSAGLHALRGVPNTRATGWRAAIGCAKRGTCARCTLASQAFPQWVLPNRLAAAPGPGIFSLRRALRRAPLSDARRFDGCGLACCAAVGGPDRQAARPRLWSRRSRAGAAVRNRVSPCGAEKAVTSAALRVADGFRLYEGRQGDTAVAVAR